MHNVGQPIAIVVWRDIARRLARLSSQAAGRLKDVGKAVDWRMKRLAWEAYSRSLYGIASLQRPVLRRTMFVGITGSAGKTTTKDLVASILERHYSTGRKGPGTLNGPYDVACLVLRTRPSDAYCVTEIALTNDAGLDLPLRLFRPTVGVVTNIGGDHVAAYGSLDGVAEEKSKLVKALPADGIAVLNADDPRVLAMQTQFSGRTVTYGVTADAMLRGGAIESSWPDRLSLTVTWNGQSARIQTQLCGDHWVSVVLAALATGLALGVPLTVAAEAVAGVEPFEARMSPVEGPDGVTFIRDDWKAPFWSIAPTFDFMRQARAARKIIVMGTISDYSGPYTPRYVKVAREALAIADCVLFVGPRASACLRAKRSAGDPLFAFPSPKSASSFLSTYLRPGDLVLLKGSVRTDHLERLILARTSRVECWRLACRRMYFCNQCSDVHTASEPVPLAESEQHGIDVKAAPLDPSTAVVVGLGNPGERYLGTRHNAGQSVVDLVAQRLTGDWEREGDLAVLLRTHLDGQPLCLVKLLTSINDAGPTLFPLAHELGFRLEQCIIVQDDLDLPVGTVRTRARGGDGGHRGVRSIVQAFQDDKFRRVKIGVGKPAPGQSIDEHVLTPFPPEKLAAVDEARREAADRVIALIRQHSSFVSPVSHAEEAA